MQPTHPLNQCGPVDSEGGCPQERHPPTPPPDPYIAHLLGAGHRPTMPALAIGATARVAPARAKLLAQHQLCFGGRSGQARCVPTCLLGCPRGMWAKRRHSNVDVAQNIISHILTDALIKSLNHFATAMLPSKRQIGLGHGCGIPEKK